MPVAILVRPIPRCFLSFFLRDDCCAMPGADVEGCCLQVEPLMRKVRQEGCVGADLSFHRVLARHPRLEPAQALMILDMMARVAFADAQGAVPAMECMAELLGRFRALESMHDFVERVARLGLGVVHAEPAPGASAQSERRKAGIAAAL
eukprot:3283593-Rhodomonas_salina.1